MSTISTHPQSELAPHSGFYQQLKFGAREYGSFLKQFSRNARLYLFGSLLMGVTSNVFQLLLNLYLQELGFAEGKIGLVISSRAIGMTAIAIPAAIILGRIRLKLVLMVSVVLFGLFSYFITSVQVLELLILFSVLAGISFTFFSVGAAPFYMRNSTSAERTHLFSAAYGIMLVAGMAGSIGSGKLVTVISDYTGSIVTGYQYTLYAGIVIGLLALIPFSMIKASRPSAEERRITLSRQQLKQRGGFYFRISFCNFLVGLGAGLIIPFLNLYFKDRFNLSPATIGLYYFVVQFSMLAGSLAGPVLAKRFGLVRAVVLTQLASIPFMLVLSYSYFLPLAFVAFIFRGGLMNLGQPIVTNLGMELSHKSEQGLVNALLMVAWTSAWMVSAALGGSLIQHYGYTVTMNITIILYVVSTLVFYVFFKKAEVKQETTSEWSLVRETLS